MGRQALWLVLALYGGEAFAATCIREQFPAGISPANPAAAAGYLDCTLFEVDPTGSLDSTDGINLCIEQATDHGMAGYLPGGTYRVSDQIYAEQPHESSLAACQDQIYSDNKLSHGKDPTLTGPASGPRPVLRLSNGSAGFGDPSAPRAIVKVENPVKGPACGFNMRVAHIHIVNGAGNEGAIGVDLRGAQGSTVHDVMVDFSAGGYACFSGHSSTDAFVDLEAVGGRYGFYPDTTVSLYFVGIRARGQTHAAFKTGYGGVVTVAGFHFQLPSGTAIVQSQAPVVGQHSFLDGVIEIGAGDDPAMVSEAAPFYVRNVWVRNTGGIVQCGAESVVPSSGAGIWDRVREYAYADKRVAEDCNGDQCDDFESFNIVDGEKDKSTYADIVRDVEAPDIERILAAHLPPPLPRFDDPDVVNIIELGAAGDGLTDDTAVFQAAAASHSKIFIPRGDYIIRGQIDFADPDVVVFGVEGMGSRIYSCRRDDGQARDHDCWEPATFRHQFATADDPDGRGVFANIKFVIPGLTSASRVGAVNWQLGRNSATLHLEASTPYGADEESFGRKVFWIHDNGGGRHYNFMAHYLAVTNGPNGTNGSGFRSLYASDTTEPLTLYSPNPEHVQCGEAEIELSNCSNARVVGIKTEAWADVVRFTGCDNVALFGLSVHTGSTPWVGFWDTTNVVATAAPRKNHYFNCTETSPNVARYVDGVLQTPNACSTQVAYFKHGVFDDEAWGTIGEPTADSGDDEEDSDDDEDSGDDTSDDTQDSGDDEDASADDAEDSIDDDTGDNNQDSGVDEEDSEDDLGDDSDSGDSSGLDGSSARGDYELVIDGVGCSSLGSTQGVLGVAVLMVWAVLLRRRR